MESNDMFTSVSHRASSAYRQVAADTQVHGASPHRLIAVLFSELLAAIATARGALARSDVALKCSAIAKAVRIVDEGLIGGLNLEAGGEVAVNLKAVYGYCMERLVHANLKNDDAALEEVSRLIRSVADAWGDIEGKAHV